MKRYLPVLVAGGILTALALAQSPEQTWLAGDSHIHSHWSPGYDQTRNPPQPIKGGDGIYSTPMNASKAKEFGLSWMVTTDHGGPNHSKLNLAEAYVELTQSRVAVPEVLQFYGMEMNMPAMDHHTLIIPNTADEWKVLFNIESQFDANEAWPVDPSANSGLAASRALAFMNGLRRLPLMFANHPSRSATGVGQYGLDEPRELRQHNDSSPEVYHGMEGAPGHQAAALRQDGSVRADAKGMPSGDRGAYRNDKAHTFGGFDQMTAIVGGLWDSMLGEGRRFWIVATSDSHVHYTEPTNPGSDFWPGEYQKTWVYARKSYDDILEGLRNGRIFVSSGDLVRQLDVVAEGGGSRAETGGTLRLKKGSSVRLTIRFRDPETVNTHGDNPKVRRVDLISGDVRGSVANRDTDRNETSRVVARFTSSSWMRSGDLYTIGFEIPNVDRNIYLRVRGTSGEELEPGMDLTGEDPWRDLWFYSNPIFVEVN